MKRLIPSTNGDTQKRRCASVLMAFACCIVFCLISSKVSAQSPSGQAPEQERLRRILLLPVFDMFRTHGENVTLIGPLSGKVFVTSQVHSGAADSMYTMLRKALARINNLELVMADRGDVEAMAGIDLIAGPRSERIATVQKIGRQRGAEAVICTYVYAFRERVGTAYGADQPARVSFELNMVSVATGRIVWQSHYSETQQPLNENVLQLGKFLKRKGRWVTTEEMAESAVNDLVGSLEDKFFKFSP